MGLPRDETKFFGRGAEIAEIERRFAAGARLLTITGIGGAGKTRLAVEAAARLVREEDGAAFVALAEARTLEAAVRAVASAVGLRIAAESKAAEGLEKVARALAARGEMLLVLDNVEQLGARAEALVSKLRDGAASLRLLATSREPTGARGEEKLLLAPLAEDDAVALLLDRARAAAGRALEIADDDARAIVARVDRLPLAIELAASRLELLTPPELVRRLADRLDVLADARATMRATLEWSWDLLTEAERSALVQLSVFAAPFGIEAAEEVVSVDGAETLDLVEGLVRRSLVARVDGQDARTRLRLFETVRAWAREKRGDYARAVEERHAHWAFAEAAHWATRTYGTDGARALDALAELLPEVTSAFEATHDEDPRSAAEGVLSLVDVLLFRGLYELRAELLGAAVGAAERAGDLALVARALVAKARVTLETGRVADAEAELRRALELASGAGDDETAAEATRSLGWALTALGRTDEAEACLARAHGMHVARGSARGEADARVALGILRALQGRGDEALACLREALAIHVERGDVVRQEKVLGFAPLVGHDAREVARGLPREVLARAPEATLARVPAGVAEAVAKERDAREGWRLALSLYAEGAEAEARGELMPAVDAFDRALATLAKSGIARGAAVVHAHAAVALARAGDHAEAEARLALAKQAAEGDVDSGLAVSVLEAAVALARTNDEATRAAARAALEGASRAGPDAAAARRVLASMLGEGNARPAAELVVGRDARWMTPLGGERIDLVRYGPVRRLLERLVEERLARPGVALTAEQLIEAGWPGERMRHSAGLLRVYSAVRRLRRLGLEPALVTRDDGYLLDEHLRVRRDPS